MKRDSSLPLLLLVVFIGVIAAFVAPSDTSAHPSASAPTVQQ